MQYILTQQEYDSLKSAQEKSINLSEKKLQTLCTKIANEMPVKWGWGGPDPKPWGCVLTNREWYCDECPVDSICPSDRKSWSK